MHAIASSFKALSSSIALLFLLMFMFGVLLSYSLHDFIRDDTEDFNWRSHMFQYYGTTLRASYAMFEITLSGCWPSYARPLIEEVNPGYIAFFIFYIVTVVF